MADFSTKVTAFTDEDSGHIFCNFFYNNLPVSIEDTLVSIDTLF